MQEEPNSAPWVLWGIRAAALAVALGVLLLTAGPVRAVEAGDTVIPMGRAVGIKLFSDGVMVVGLAEVDTASGGSAAPARSCGLQEGDIITHINSEEVDSIEEVQSILQNVGDADMSIRARRDGQELQVTAHAVQCSADGSYKLGAWIRDSMAGIGTLTFYDPESQVFGALGHAVSDVDTAQLMPLQSGSILYAQVEDVQKGQAGAPGELHGTFQTDRDLGELSANTTGGLFGTLTDASLVQGLQPMPVAGRD